MLFRSSEYYGRDRLNHCTCRNFRPQLLRCTSDADKFNVAVKVIRKSGYVPFDMVDKFINSYAELLSAGVLETSEIFEDDASINFYCENQLIATADVGNRVQKTKDISICDVNLHVDEVISPAMFEEIIQSLKRVRGLKVIPLSRSYQGSLDRKSVV